MTLIKEDLVRKIMTSTKLERTEAKKILEHLLTQIKMQLSNGNDIQISSFGSFRINSKNMRIGRNPKTGKEHLIRKRKIVKFYPSKILRSHLNSGETELR